MVAVETLAFRPTGMSQNRTLGAWLTAEYLSVKDFGAVGDGSNDDTTAIQNTLNAAYSNGANWYANKPVYFPPGDYRVIRPVYIHNTYGAKVFGAGRVTTRIRNDGTTATASFNGYIVPGASGDEAGVLTVTSMTSGTIYVGGILATAAGGFTADTSIGWQLSGTPGGVGTYSVLGQTVGSVGTPVAFTAKFDTAFYCNGCGYSEFSNITFQSVGGGHTPTVGTGMGFDWDWARVVTDNNGGQLTSWIDCGFAGKVGCRVGFSGAQCDTSTFIGCNFTNNGTGLAVYNQNVIGINVYGGDFQTNDVGIYMGGGQVSTICGVAFQISSPGPDIDITAGINGPLFIAGIDSESANFLRVSGGYNQVFVCGCGQRSFADGYFLTGGLNAHVSIDGCTSVRGNIVLCSPVTINNCHFGRQDAFAGYDTRAYMTLRLKSTFAGNPIDYGGHFYRDVAIIGGARRTYEIEGTSLTDPNILYDSLNQSTNPAQLTMAITSISNGSPAVVTIPNNYYADMPVCFVDNAGDTLPSPLLKDKVYYVKSPTGSSFNLAATAGGAAINTTTAGSGSHLLAFPRPYAVGDQILKSNAASGGSPGWICTTAGYSLPESGGGAGAVLKPFTNTIT